MGESMAIGVFFQWKISEVLVREVNFGYPLVWNSNGAAGMATPGELIRTVASALDVSEVTVGVYYRNLREANLVTKGGRGRSAPSLTYLDASRLVIALMVSDTAIQAARETRRYGRLPLTLIDGSSNSVVYPGFYRDRFSKLNFESGTEYILEVVAASDFEHLISDELYPLVITAKSNLTAEIHFSYIDAYYDDLPSDWTFAETGARISPSRQEQLLRMPTGLQVQRSVGGTALAQIAACIES